MITATTAGPNSSNSQEVETTATTVVRTTTRTPTTTATPTPTPTATPTPTPTPTSSAPPKPTNSLDVDTEEIDGQAHHFLTYSLQEARLQIYQQLLDNDYPNGARAIVALSTYPTQDSRQSEALTVAESDLIHGVNSADTRLTIRLDFDASSEPFYLWSMLIDANTEMADATSGDVDTLAQTDRLIVANNRLQRDPPALEKETIRHDRYERINVEGRYLLQFSGRGPYSDWTPGSLPRRSDTSKRISRPGPVSIPSNKLNHA